MIRFRSPRRDSSTGLKHRSLPPGRRGRRGDSSSASSPPAVRLPVRLPAVATRPRPCDSRPVKELWSTAPSVPSFCSRVLGPALDASPTSTGSAPSMPWCKTCPWDSGKATMWPSGVFCHCTIRLSGTPVLLPAMLSDTETGGGVPDRGTSIMGPWLVCTMRPCSVSSMSVPAVSCSTYDACAVFLSSWSRGCEDGSRLGVAARGDLSSFVHSSLTADRHMSTEGCDMSAALSTAWCCPALAAVAEADVGVAAVTARLGEAAARRADAAAAAVMGLPVADTT
mmetsp:Transcript_8191/g.24367  ORF Transcript_8191/g.24367 Transcript_8191/m.24367 type:complete len:282 (+) Transcript_8191:1011-1856(+)